MTIDVKDAGGVTVAIEKPLAPGRAAAAASKPVVLSNEDLAVLTAINAKDFATQTTLAAILAKIIAAPATEATLAAQSAKMPATLGQKTMANSMAVTLPSDQTVKSGPDIIIAVGSTLTRPANTTTYTANDSVSDNATAGSVTAQTVSLSDTNNEPITIERVRLATTDTGFAAGTQIRMYCYNSSPIASSGVGAGDNAAFSNKMAGFIGCLSGTFRPFSDGGVAILTPDEGARIATIPGSGAQTIWWQLQTLSAPVPSANGTTFIPTFEGFQGRV